MISYLHPLRAWEASQVRPLTLHLSRNKAPGRLPKPRWNTVKRARIFLITHLWPHDLARMFYLFLVGWGRNISRPEKGAKSGVRVGVCIFRLWSSGWVLSSSLAVINSCGKVCFWFPFIILFRSLDFVGRNVKVHNGNIFFFLPPFFVVLRWGGWGFVYNPIWHFFFFLLIHFFAWYSRLWSWQRRLLAKLDVRSIDLLIRTVTWLPRCSWAQTMRRY